MPSKAEIKAYLKDHVNPMLEPLVLALISKQPIDIYEFSIRFLQEKKSSNDNPHKRPNTVTQPERVYTDKEQSSKSSLDEARGKKGLSGFQYSSDEHSDEDEDDVDDEILEQQRKKNMAKGARGSVSAEVYGAFNKKEDFVARVITKTAEQKQRIVDKLSKSFMFASLEDKEKQIVVDAMEEKTFKKDDWVIRQGEDGAELYILDEGRLDCYKQFRKDEEAKLVKTYNPGESFGELALLYNAPRAASIKAVTDSVMFALDRATFNNIVKDAEVKRRERFEHILTKIEILESMDPYERSKIADTAAIVKVKSGDYVIRQGERGDRFFFVDDGTAVATKVLKGKSEPETVYNYKSGDYFGELALLKDEPRAANVIAESDLTLLSLDRDAFNRVLGPLTDILKRNTNKYEKFM